MNFFKQNYPRVPIMALTATASEKVILDIIHNLQMDNPVMLKSSFNRTNLFYTVRNKPPAIYEWISNYILSKHKGQTGIIYCHSKQSCETTSQKLNECGISCLYYMREWISKKDSMFSSNGRTTKFNSSVQQSHLVWELTSQMSDLSFICISPER